jgi:hypothetical protein
MSPEFFAPNDKPWNNGQMKRMRLLFAILLVLFALPFWRFADMVAILSPFDWPLPLALTLWFGVFIAIPAKLIFSRIKSYMLVLSILSFASLAWWTSPLSAMATDNPNFNHCGRLTYTGLVYPVHELLSDAHRDDLEVRNQMCWVRKMISRVPRQFDSIEEIEFYSQLIRNKLLKPEIKYRATLPLVAVLYFTINTSASRWVGAKQIFDSLHFWISHYTEEINQREYSLWNWPHSGYIQFEYGIIEKNWQRLIDNIVIEH